MATTEMGYKNYQAAVQNVIGRSKLMREYHGIMSADTTAFGVLVVMCLNTYDYPLPDKLRRLNSPARLYRGGIKRIVEQMGLVSLPAEQVLNGDAEQTTKELDRRKRSAVTRVSRALRFLQKRGVVKVLQKGYLGRNTAYLLCIGATDEENDTVEHYDRRVLGLPTSK